MNFSMPPLTAVRLGSKQKPSVETHSTACPHFLLLGQAPSYFPAQNSARLNGSQTQLVEGKLQGRTDLGLTPRSAVDSFR